jgi:hypothetical protein
MRFKSPTDDWIGAISFRLVQESVEEPGLEPAGESEQVLALALVAESAGGLVPAPVLAQVQVWVAELWVPVAALVMVVGDRARD